MRDNLRFERAEQRLAELEQRLGSVELELIRQQLKKKPPAKSPLKENVRNKNK